MDFSYLISISDGDEVFIQDFVSTFERNTAKIIKDIKTNMTDGNLDAARKLAHQLKPSLEMLGLDSLKIALNIQHEPDKTTSEDIQKLETECTEAVQKMKSEFNL